MKKLRDKKKKERKKKREETEDGKEREDPRYFSIDHMEKLR